MSIVTRARRASDEGDEFRENHVVLDIVQAHTNGSLYSDTSKEVDIESLFEPVSYAVEAHLFLIAPWASLTETYRTLPEGHAEGAPRVAVTLAAFCVMISMVARGMVRSPEVAIETILRTGNGRFLDASDLYQIILPRETEGVPVAIREKLTQFFDVGNCARG
jgi:hypothetical protein